MHLQDDQLPDNRSGGIIALTTDFGMGSHYVAAMKGVILSLNPRATLVDITHGVPPQDVRQGAWILADVAEYLPPGSIHVAVVDPGVGSRRKIVYAEIDQRGYVAPDNGLLSRLALRTPPTKIVAIQEPAYWLRRVSATFHGRDIMAPVAARLSLGLQPDCLGPPQDSLMQLDWSEVIVLPGRIEGTVRLVDSFGNLITDIPADALAGVPTDESVKVACDAHQTVGIFCTYADQPEMTLVALVGSSGYLELAIVGDSAAAMLGVGTGARVTITWS